jgi:hypothetical protein
MSLAQPAKCPSASRVSAGGTKGRTHAKLVQCTKSPGYPEFGAGARHVLRVDQEAGGVVGVAGVRFEQAVHVLLPTPTETMKLTNRIQMAMATKGTVRWLPKPLRLQNDKCKIESAKQRDVIPTLRSHPCSASAWHASKLPLARTRTAVSIRHATIRWRRVGNSVHVTTFLGLSQNCEIVRCNIATVGRRLSLV